MNLKTFCLTAAVATLSLNATWVHAEEDDANEFETNTVNSQWPCDPGVDVPSGVSQLYLFSEDR